MKVGIPGSVHVAKSPAGGFLKHRHSGGVEGAIEPLCVLWCISGFLRNQWTHAFKLLE